MKIKNPLFYKVISIVNLFKKIKKFFINNNFSFSRGSNSHFLIDIGKSGVIIKNENLYESILKNELKKFGSPSLPV